jgi:hypothetical protein
MARPGVLPSLLGLAVLVHAGCRDDLPQSATPAAPPAPALAGPTLAGPARSQAVPHAVFATTPEADGEGRIVAASPLGVQFNMCRSRAADPGDELRFTYDWDADGSVDEHGHCRARHVFTESARARVCVSDRRPDGSACRTYSIELSGDPPPPVEHVLTLALNSCQQQENVRFQWLEARIDPPIPPGQPYGVSVAIDGELGGAPFRQTLATVTEDQCTDFLGYFPDGSPLPNEHVMDMPPRPCAHGLVFVLSAIEATGPPLAARLDTTVTDFRVPGRRARIEGRTTFTCP